MPGNISQFIADINQRGVAKTSHFDVRFTLPPVLSKGAVIPHLLSLRCESSELPGRQIATTENRIYGPIYKVPFDSIYSETTMTFVDTSDMLIRSFFEIWMDLIFNSDNNSIQYPDNIVSNITVVQYDTTGTQESLNPVLAFELIRAFPVNINQLALAWGDDSLHKLAVTLFYERYRILNQFETAFSTTESLDELASGPLQEGEGRATAATDRVQTEMERAKNTSEDYMIEYPESPDKNDIQITEMARAKEEAAKSSRSDIGFLRELIADLPNKVKNII